MTINKEMMVIMNIESVNIREINAHGVKMQQIQGCLYYGKGMFYGKAAGVMMQLAQIAFLSSVEP